MRHHHPYPMIGVGGVIFNSSNQSVVLIQRANPPSQGKWSVPGGLVEFGEDLASACKREIEEETGLTVKLNPQPIMMIERFIQESVEENYHYLIIDFVGFVESGNLKAASDANQAAWVKLEDLNRYPLTQGLKETIAKAHDSIQKNATIDLLTIGFNDEG